MVGIVNTICKLPLNRNENETFFCKDLMGLGTNPDLQIVDTQVSNKGNGLLSCSLEEFYSEVMDEKKFNSVKGVSSADFDDEAKKLHERLNLPDPSKKYEGGST